MRPLVALALGYNETWRPAWLAEGGVVLPPRAPHPEIAATFGAAWNVAFYRANGTWNGIGRWLHSNDFANETCAVSKARGHSQLTMARAFDVRDFALAHFQEFSAPENAIRCAKFLGEPKLFALRETRYVYAHALPQWTNHTCEFGEEAFGTWNETRRECFRRSRHKNFFFRPGKKNDAVLLSYTERPDPEVTTAKNFVFFECGEDALCAVVLVQPHRIYRVDAASGFMEPLSTAWGTRLGFGPHVDLRLSAGVVKLDGSYLVAAHVAPQPLFDGEFPRQKRMTFFYEFSPDYPHGILCATPLVSFGFSETLEYVTHLERHGDHLFVSFGIDNCFSALVQLPVEVFKDLCLPPPVLHPNFLLVIDLRNRTLRRSTFDPISPL